MYSKHGGPIEIEVKNLSTYFCHRIPERTFKIKNHYFPVCARCTGAYIGLFSYFTFVYFVFIQYTLPVILLGTLMIVPMALDGVTQFMDLRESKNSLRFFTGLIGGIGLGIMFKALKMVLLN
ncbi:MAG: DUF2085 domain-containing protein [Methanobacterium sp.]